MRHSALLKPMMCASRPSERSHLSGNLKRRVKNNTVREVKVDQLRTRFHTTMAEHFPVPNLCSTSLSGWRIPQSETKSRGFRASIFSPGPWDGRLFSIFRKGKPKQSQPPKRLKREPAKKPSATIKGSASDDVQKSCAGILTRHGGSA